jgi:hypothetical protein
MMPYKWVVLQSYSQLFHTELFLWDFVLVMMFVTIFAKAKNRAKRCLISFSIPGVSPRVTIVTPLRGLAFTLPFPKGEAQAT